jgi:hypothetical protein
MSIEFDINKFIGGAIKQAVTRSFLNSIQILEDIKADGRMDEEEFTRLRKRVLDSGNNAIRDINTALEGFDLVFKRNKE